MAIFKTFLAYDVYHCHLFPLFSGAYRALYILNWVYRFFMENKIRWIPWVSGLIQTALYADFFYYYFKSWKNRENLKLPA
ncbi:hypothetical protein Patl1_24512 [Pistacia atlantica]|uniref:Uncharacterized protein n=1 Tax=Pistacia atlantica TaxID=434234 RepID=A0ACC0ZZD0_9ROSI|nr:hypothetical protein Patl1_24512 [Pistacia atlantica]